VSVIQKARPGGGGGPLPPRLRRRRPLLLLLALVATLAALWWLRAEEPSLPPGAAPSEAPLPLGAGSPPLAEPAPAPAPEPELEAAAEPVPAEPLPSRADSDGLARDLARGVSSHPLFLALLTESGLVDRFVLLVDNLAEGIVPRRELAFLRPKDPFLVRGAEPALRVDPASYARYDALAAAIASLDARAAAAAYHRLAPLCEESYRALGYPEGGFEQRLRAALALLGSTPRSDADPALVAETKRYEFADPSLESLSDAQKQLLRMGPANAARVTAKLAEIEAALAGARGER
jgi:hypothetical protein